MKKLFLITSALLVAVSFNACTNDDNENGGGGDTRIVSQIIQQNEDGTTEIYKFYYDDQGRITKITSDNGYTEFTYSGNKVTIIEHYEGENHIYHETYHATLDEQGYIATLSKVGGNTSYYSYDKNGYLLSKTWWDDRHGFGEVQCAWNNGDLMEEHRANFDPIDSYYEYTNYLAKQNIDIYAFTYGYCHMGDPELIGAVGLVGRKSAHLIKSANISSSDESDNISLSYELDSNGNPTKITEFGIYGTPAEYETTTYKILYE